jgi:sugar lactone lactonase YvrE
MNTSLIFLVALFLSSAAYGQYYEVSDLTEENLFTNNIEGPNTDSNNRLFVVNFQRDGTIGEVHEDGTVDLFVTLPDGSIGNAIVFDAQGNMLLADWKGHNVLKVHTKTKAISVYRHSDQFNQPNDLCINRQGQLFVSDPNWKESTGQLWRIDKDGAPILLAEAMGTTNGITLSPDEKILYVNESVQRKIWSFSIEEDGSLSHKKLIAEFEGFGLDGMKCDAEGNLYVARYDKGTIAILSPQGKLLREVILKGKKVSNLTFGSKDGRTCYVTLQDRGCIETFRSAIRGKKNHSK